MLYDGSWFEGPPVIPQKAPLFGRLFCVQNMNNKKIVIGLVGETGSGKDTVANYIHTRYEAYLVRFADPVKEMLHLYFDHTSKEDQAWLCLQLKQHFGKDVLGRAIGRRIQTVEGLISVNGLRFPEDEDFVRSYENSYVIYVTASQRTRWERVHRRGEKTDDDTSFEHFQEFEKTETERHIPEIGGRADFRLENDGSLDDLLAKADAAMTKILGE